MVEINLYLLRCQNLLSLALVLLAFVVGFYKYLYDGHLCLRVCCEHMTVFAWQVTVMKGSSRNKDHSTEGEGTGKRPKRKCLQWHPLLAKKLLDFSEEEEEEEEEEDIDKVDFIGYLGCRK